MKFVVNFRTGKSSKTRRYPHVELTQDNWDDYGYKTTFDATLRQAEDDEIELGTLKIMKASQDGGYTDLPKRAFETLGSKFCSLGGDLDYYEKLFKLGPSIYLPYLKGLSDAVFSDDIRASFEDTEGFRVLLFEPLRVCRRLVTSFHATISNVLSCA